MSWTFKALEPNQEERQTIQPQARDAESVERQADEADEFGAFYVPREEPQDEQNRLQKGTGEPWDWERNGEDPVQNCTSCKTLTDGLHRLRCGHLWDRNCLTAVIELALRWEGNWPAKCCQKFDDCEMKELAPFLGEEVVGRYQANCEEMETPREQRIYCADPFCSAFLGRRGTDNQLATCRRCKATTCLACSTEESLHDEERCPPGHNVVSYEELIRAGKLQQCPGCPEVVELREACNHITCVCGTDFCFSCGAIWRTCFCSLYPGWEDRVKAGEEGLREGEDEIRAAVPATCLHPIMDNATRRARCEYCGHSSRYRMYICVRCRTAACRDCYERLNMFAIGAAALRQEAAQMRENVDREDELAD